MQKSNNPAGRLDWDDLRFFLEVARTQKASATARRLGVDYTTVSRRIAVLEKVLGALLFEKSRSTGFSLTMEGQRLLVYAETLESTLQSACEQISDTRLASSGQVRIGATEGFGSYFVAPQLSFFQDRYPGITLEVLPVPHFVNLSRREADIAITLERPERGPYVCRKLCDYRLRLYATADYLASHPPIAQLAHLRSHRFITYVDDLAFSPELLYLERILPEACSNLRSTSVIAQYQAALCGHALAILPCFVAEPDPRLVALLPEQIQITRQFWLYYREDLRRLRRTTLVTDYLRACTDANRDFLLGDTRAPVLGWPAS